MKSIKIVLNRFVCGIPIFSFDSYSTHYPEADSNYNLTHPIDYGGFAKDKNNLHSDYLKIASDIGKAWEKIKEKEEEVYE
jgi:hypothetical protein